MHPVSDGYAIGAIFMASSAWSEKEAVKRWRALSTRGVLQYASQFLDVNWANVDAEGKLNEQIGDDKSYEKRLALAIAIAAFSWAWRGFPDAERKRHFFTIVQCAILCWLLHGKRSRESRILWTLAASLSAILGLFQLQLNFGSRRHIRVIMRMAYPGVQYAVAQQWFWLPAWKDYLRQLFIALWKPDSSKHWVYAAFSGHSSVWYVGRAAGSRRRNQQTWSGTAARYREHVVATRAGTEQSHRPRYGVWANGPMHALYFVPAVAGTSKTIDKYEQYAIRALQPPTQQAAKEDLRARAKEKKFRPWRRLRSLPTLRTELHLNLCECIRRSPTEMHKFQRLWATYDDAITWLWDNCMWTEQYVRRRLYEPQFAHMLLLFLAKSRNKLHYYSVWRWKWATTTVLELWHAAGGLEVSACRRVRQKLERFLQTGRLVQTRVNQIRVRTTDKSHIAAVKRAAEETLREAGLQLCLRRFLCKKLRVVPERVPNIADQLSDQIQHARHFYMGDVAELSSDDVRRFRLREDIDILPYHCSLEAPISVAELRRDVVPQLSDWIKRIGFAELEADLEQKCQWQHLHDPTWIKIPQQFIEQVRAAADGRILVPLDRDTKRRAAMEPLGYACRLFEGYMADTEFYEVLPSVSTKQFCEERERRIRQQLPKSFWPPFPLFFCNQARGYHNYKGKCLTHIGDDARGLVCGKSHAHEREVCAGSQEPMLRTLSLHARALRLAKRSSHEPSWSLWDQSDLAAVLQNRVEKLQYHSQYVLQCPCGRKKCTPLSLLKVDANQFFKAADARRGIRRCKRFLDRVRDKRKVNAVAVKRSSRAEGFLCQASKPVSKQFRICKFEDIIAAMSFCALDSSFFVGDVLVQRRQGYAMGSSFSEPATLVDLGECIYRLYTDPAFALRIGWDCKGFRTEQVVQGLQHVDDAIVFSKILCVRCLMDGIEQLWPKDVGFSIEGEGPEVDFLAAKLCISSEASNFPVSISPKIVNLDFALHSGAHLAKSRFQRFLAFGLQTKKQLRALVLQRLCLCDRLTQGSIEGASTCVSELVGEIFRLGWPLQWISYCFQTYPRKYQSRAAVAFRVLGKILRKLRLESNSSQEVVKRSMDIFRGLAQDKGVLEVAAGVALRRRLQEDLRHGGQLGERRLERQ